MSLINRAASIFVRRPCVVPRRKNISYAHFSVALQQPQRISVCNRNGIMQQTPLPAHDISITNKSQIRRSMVMVTQTISSEKEDEDTNSPTSQQRKLVIT